jgi:hypothetical protein
MTVAEAPSNGPNPYKRAHVGTGVENDTPGISGLVKEHCKDLLAPIIRERVVIYYIIILICLGSISLD